LLPSIGDRFLPAAGTSGALVFAVLVFAAGVVVRPAGAIVFGRLGDRFGRRPTLAAALALSGLATLLVGLVPTYASAGLAAPIALVVLRLLQGLALGGAAGGSLVYVAEQARAGRRGLMVSGIQTAMALGVVLALSTIFAVRQLAGDAGFSAWGWRVPFVVSALVLALSAWVRLKLPESTVFEAGKAAQAQAGTPASRIDMKRLGLAFLGIALGQATVWLMGPVFATTYLRDVLHLSAGQVEGMAALALLAALPFFLLFGWLSDRIGRKWIIMAGCALAAAAYIPLFHTLTIAAHPGIVRAQEGGVVKVVADPRDCSVQFDPLGQSRFKTTCDLAKGYLARAGVPYVNEAAYPNSPAGVQVGGCATCYVESVDPTHLSAAERIAAENTFKSELGAALTHAGYPSKVPAWEVNQPVVIGILFLLALFAAIVTGPGSTMLAEMFPTANRSTAVNLTYQSAEAWVAGLAPAASFAFVAATGNMLQGLWVPIALAALSVIVGVINLADTRKVDIAV